MTRTPRVSVLMTVYNAAPYLRQAIDSIVHQTFEDWELIVVENGSTDASADIVASYADPRVRTIRLSTNIGRTPALRRAFEEASAEYIAVLDADDVSRADRFARQVAYLDEHPAIVLVGSWARIVDGDGRVSAPPFEPAASAEEVYQRLAWANPIVHSTAMYRRSVAADVGGYPAEFRHSQDGALWLRLAERGPLGMIPLHLSDFRIVTTSASKGGGYRLDVPKERTELLRYARSRLRLGSDALQRNADEILIEQIKYGIELMRSGAIARGLQAWAGAIVRHPLGLFHNRVVRQRLERLFEPSK